MDIVAAILASFFIQLGAHFIPWAALFGKRKLPRLAAYTIGVFVLSVIFTLWLLTHDQGETVTVYWLIVIASGAGVATGYGVDWIIATRARAREAEEREELQERLRNV
jgi:hypothetical protein